MLQRAHVCDRAPQEGVWFGLGAVVVCDVYLMGGWACIAFRRATARALGGCNERREMRGGLR